MPEAFKVEVKSEMGKDKVEIKETADAKKITDRHSDAEFMTDAVKELRRTYVDLEAKLKKAQGTLGTSVKGLSDAEINLAAQYAQAKLNELGNNFLTAFNKEEVYGNDKYALQGYDMRKAQLLKDHIVYPLGKYIDGQLNKVIAAVDDQDADPGRTEMALNPKTRGDKIRTRTGGKGLFGAALAKRIDQADAPGRNE